MSRCKYCEQNNVITEGEWRQTQYGNRLFVNNEQHKCPYYKKAAPTTQQLGQNMEHSGTYVPQGYVQEQRTQQPAPPEPAVLTQLVTKVDAIQIKLVAMAEQQQKIFERIDFMYRIERVNQEEKLKQEGENL